MYNIRQFPNLIGYSVKTLQRWDRENILKPETRTKTNRRLYTDNQLLEINNKISVMMIGYHQNKNYAKI